MVENVQVKEYLIKLDTYTPIDMFQQYAPTTAEGHIIVKPLSIIFD